MYQGSNALNLNALNMLDGDEQVKTILTEKMKTIKLPVQMLAFVDNFYLR